MGRGEEQGGSKSGSRCTHSTAQHGTLNQQQLLHTKLPGLLMQYACMGAFSELVAIVLWGIFLQGVLVANRRSLTERPAQLLPVVHELLERLDAHLKAEDYYSGVCVCALLLLLRAAMSRPGGRCFEALSASDLTHTCCMCLLAAVIANMRGESPEAVAATLMAQPGLQGLQGPTISPVYGPGTTAPLC